MVSLLLILSRIHTFFWWFNCWLSTSNYRLGRLHLNTDQIMWVSDIIKPPYHANDYKEWNLTPWLINPKQDQVIFVPDSATELLISYTGVFCHYVLLDSISRKSQAFCFLIFCFRTNNFGYNLKTICGKGKVSIA